MMMLDGREWSRRVEAGGAYRALRCQRKRSPPPPSQVLSPSSLPCIPPPPASLFIIHRGRSLPPHPRAPLTSHLLIVVIIPSRKRIAQALARRAAVVLLAASGTRRTPHDPPSTLGKTSIEEARLTTGHRGPEEAAASRARGSGWCAACTPEAPAPLRLHRYALKRNTTALHHTRLGVGLRVRVSGWVWVCG